MIKRVGIYLNTPHEMLAGYVSGYLETLRDHNKIGQIEEVNIGSSIEFRWHVTTYSPIQAQAPQIESELNPKISGFLSRRNVNPCQYRLRVDELPNED
ncbi:MAG: hypothetical protein HY518_02370 [Candidatus Aenigmarchaeota archaeon]|nr:hypothetical protein [Candidatus Aenigmarchaeota archaeon]